MTVYWTRTPNISDGVCDDQIVESHLKVHDIIHGLAIKACAHLKDLQKGKQIIRENIPNFNGNKKCNKLKDAMIEMYLHCGDVDSAQLMFEGLRNKDIRSYNAMIKGFMHLKQYKKALLYYDLSNSENIPNDEVSHLFAQSVYEQW